MIRVLRLYGLPMFGLVWLASCSTTPPLIPVAPLPTPILPAPLPPADLSSLSGRSICIDPGHGGPWPGAISPHTGQTEADVNLRVSLELAKILEGAGAHVHLTRTTDRALSHESAGADIRARADFANRSGAEVFLSVHHNADIVPASTRDDLEMYYALRDDGASLVLAQHLTHAVSARFRPDAARKRLLPGNYRILRESRAPAVLLESAYLTHAPSAVLLATPQGVRAEAEAIAAGLASYFDLDPLSLENVRAVTDNATGLTALSIDFRGAPIEPASVTVLVNGAVRHGVVTRSARGFEFVAREPLPNGSHEVTLRVRNIHGSPLHETFVITVDRPPAALSIVQSPPDPQPDRSGEILVAVHVLDAAAKAIADGTTVRLGPHTAHTRGGVARFYVPPADLPDTLEANCGAVRQTFRVQRGSGAYPSVRVISSRDGAPVPGAVLYGASRPLTTTNFDGWASLPGPIRELRVEQNGFEPAAVRIHTASTTIKLNPIQPRAADHVLIYIDPLDGGRDPGAEGPRGLRASDAAYAVAEALLGRLEAAGIRAMISRRGDQEVSELARVRMAEQLGATFYLAITFGLNPQRARLMDGSGYQIEPPAQFIAHYPGSQAGLRWAHALSAATRIPAIASTVYYPVQQASAPAVLVQLADIRNPDTEDALLRFGLQKARGDELAQAILNVVQNMNEPN